MNRRIVNRIGNRLHPRAQALANKPTIQGPANRTNHGDLAKLIPQSSPAYRPSTSPRRPPQETSPSTSTSTACTPHHESPQRTPCRPDPARHTHPRVAMAHTIVQNISARLHRSPGTGMTTATGTDRDQRSTGNGNANANGNANGDDRDQRSTATSISHRPSTTDRSPRPTDPSPRSRSTSPRSPSTSRSPPGGASDDQQAARSTPASTPGADSADAGAGPPASRLCKDDFTLLKTLGTGTFARVWLARVAPAAAAGRKTETPAVVALKVLRKADVVRLKQVEHVRAEREVLARVTGHPFITALVGAFQTRTALYLALEFCAGGEVFSYLRRARRFAEGTARFYAAEIVLVLGFLHERHGVAYRDLKPENVLLDAQGHVKLVDFGFAKKIDSRKWGTPLRCTLADLDR